MRHVAKLGLLALCGLVACGNDEAGVTPQKDTTASSGGSGGDGGATSGGGGSGADDGGPAAFTGGSRLKVRRLVADDGSVQLLGFHDSELGVNCGFTRASDGAMRCLPSNVAAAGSYFADAACSEPAVIGLKNCDQPDFAISLEGVCGDHRRVHQLGAELTSLYTGTPSSCLSQVALLATYRAWALGGSVSPGEFVLAEESVD